MALGPYRYMFCCVFLSRHLPSAHMDQASFAPCVQLNVQVAWYSPLRGEAQLELRLL